tara:strand:+ start:4075 stop:4461 length:387 start_codon:yes stop_codon:yes gene_type:complete
VTFINVDQTFPKILSKRGRYECHFCALAVYNHCAVLFIKIDGSHSLMVFLQPSFDKTTIIVLEDLSSSVDQDSDAGLGLPKSAWIEQLFQQAFLAQALVVHVDHANILPIAILEQIRQHLCVCMCELW